MYLSRAAIALLSTVLGCRQFIQWVEAFGRSSLSHSHRSPTKLAVAFESAEEQEEDRVWPHHCWEQEDEPEEESQ